MFVEFKVTPKTIFAYRPLAVAEAQFNVQRNNDGCYANINGTTIFYDETIS